MRWKLLENPQQNLSLQIFQPRFRSFDQPDGPELFRQNSIVIVLESRLGLFVAQSSQIGEPSQFAGTHSEPFRQISRRFDCRNISGPVAGEHGLVLSRDIHDSEFVGVFRPRVL